MRIVVCIKQVPVLSALQFDPATKTLKRDGVPSEVSAFDLRALIKAVELKAAHGGEVVVITMGPPQARAALLDCLALGADRAVHLCDRAFAGSDTLATARALALAVARESFDLILCGRNSVDAETGQVGPELAELLQLPQVTGARTVTVDAQAMHLTAERETDDGFETVSVPLPALVTAAEDLAPERFPSKNDRAAAQGKPCSEVHAAELSVDPARFGFSGSPTQVVGLHQVATARLGRVIEGSSVDETAARLVRTLIEEHGLFGTWRVREQPKIAQIAPAPQRRDRTDVWVIAEQIGGRMRPVVFELLGKAAALAGAVSGRVGAVLLGGGAAETVTALAERGADHVLIADDPSLTTYDTEALVTVLADMVRSRAPGMVLFPATTLGRDVAPRLAARLQIGLTGDCIDLGLDAEGRLLQYKPAFGGSVVAPIVSRTLPEMATVRPGMLASPGADATRRAAVERVAVPAVGRGRVRVVERRAGAATALELDNAPIVVGVGKGLGDKAHLGAIRPLAELLGAAICTTRDVTDAGWLPKQYQVGLTGRAIAPRLYLAIGIRGAFEHLVGVRRAGLIIGINKNAKAPIFKGADYGIVGDYAQVVPALVRCLSRTSPQPAGG